MFKGLMPALVTPFADGALDLTTLKALVERQIKAGCHGLVPVGTTGESPTLTLAEHETVVAEVVKAAAGRVPVIAGAGSNNTAESMRLMQHAKSVGADAALVVTPYYNKPTQAGLFAHYEAIVAETDVPIVLYNVPPRTACDMQAETVAALSELGQIVGIKEACGDANRVREIRSRVKDDFIIFHRKLLSTKAFLKFSGRLIS